VCSNVSITELPLETDTITYDQNGGVFVKLPCNLFPDWKVSGHWQKFTFYCCLSLSLVHAEVVMSSSGLRFQISLLYQTRTDETVSSANPKYYGDSIINPAGAVPGLSQRIYIPQPEAWMSIFVYFVVAWILVNIQMMIVYQGSLKKAHSTNSV
jgi:hypothetical protein